MRNILTDQRWISPGCVSDRLMVGLWFGAMSSIPILAFFVALNPRHSVESYVLFILLPFLSASSCGATFGASILSHEQTWAFWRSVRRGVLVALIAYLAFALLFAALLSGAVLWSYLRSGVLPGDLSGLTFLFSAAVLGVLVIGPFMLPWMVPLFIVSGGSAGALLDQNRSRVVPLVLLGCAVSVLVGGILLFRLPDWENPPLYPNATHVEISNWQTVASGTATERGIVFETSDPPETVRTSYPRLLAAQGWQQEQGSRFASPLAFQVNGFESYNLQVEVEPIAYDFQRKGETEKRPFKLGRPLNHYSSKRKSPRQRRKKYGLPV